MSTKEAYKQKVEAELELVQAKLAEFKAHAKSLTADAGIAYAKQVDQLEQRMDATKASRNWVRLARALGSSLRTVWRALGIH